MQRENNFGLYLAIILAIAAMAALACNGCTTLPATPAAQEADVAAMPFTVNGLQYRGIALLPGLPLYKMQFQPEGKVAKLLLHTCHRDVELFSPFEFTYMPIRKVENTSDPCMMHVKAISDKGESSYAKIDFLFPDPVLQYSTAYVACDGNLQRFQGSMFCQARAGLIQYVTLGFLPTFADSEGDCSKPVKESDADYRVTVSKGVCRYMFGSSKKEIFTLTTYGYERK